LFVLIDKNALRIEITPINYSNVCKVQEQISTREEILNAGPCLLFGRLICTLRDKYTYYS